MRDLDRQYAFDDWMDDIRREHPDCDVRPTRRGCEVRDDNGELVTEYDYEPDPYAEQRVRY